MQTEPLSILNPEPTLAAQPTISLLSALSPQPLFSPEQSDAGLSLNRLPATSDFGLRPSDLTPVPTVMDAKPLPASVQPNKARRRGRVACLPKTQRDMVNRMLSNGVPYKNIVAALDENGFKLTERNISNWNTGGYLEWHLAQDLVLQNRLDQDHLVDHLRRDDASELPEVGLQAAATRLSQLLLLKTARADDIETNLGSFSQMVDVLCRLNREIAALQKQRDESRRSLGRAFDPARIKDEEEMSAIEQERFYSSPSSDSGLAKPALPPALPPIPTSSILAAAYREAAETRKAESQSRVQAIIQSIAAKNAPASTDPALLPSPEAAPERFGSLQ